METPRENKQKILTLEPSELRFSGPLVRPSITLVTLKNPNNFDVMYKFKTTAPRIYRVRPNLGIVLSNNVSTVRIVLMPFAFDLKERLVHKFMVLTAPAPKDFHDLRKAWSDLDEDKMWCEKFKSIIDMGKAISPLQIEQIELSPSNTSADLNHMEMPASAVGDSSQSENNFHGHSNNNIESIAANFPPIDHDVKFAILRNENAKLINENETLRRENLYLNIELERLRSLKIENDLNDTTNKKGINNGNKIMLFLATSVTMAILCTVIGKCIFSDQLPLDGLQNFLEYMVY